jgi:Uma2 family endonuclease
MVQPRRQHHRHTYAQFVAVEMDCPLTKHEFVAGDIYAMSPGVTADQSALASTVMCTIGTAVHGGRRCRAFGSDLRIYIKAADVATFPDGSVICGPVERHPAGPDTTALNPTMLLEVTSDSSEDYDNGDKLAFYKMIPSLHEVVIVSHRERRITVHRREHGEWMSQVAVAGGKIRVTSVGAELVVDEVYAVSSIA